MFVTVCHIKSTFHHTSQSDPGMVVVAKNKTTFHNDDFFFLSQLMRHPLINLAFLPFLYASMLNNHSVADIEFFSNFSGSCERISFDDPSSWSLSTSDGWLLRSSSKLSSPLQNFAKPLLHCTFVSSSWVKCITHVASCLCCFATHFELK